MQKRIFVVAIYISLRKKADFRVFFLLFTATVCYRTPGPILIPGVFNFNFVSFMTIYPIMMIKLKLALYKTFAVTKGFPRAMWRTQGFMCDFPCYAHINATLRTNSIAESAVCHIAIRIVLGACKLHRAGL